MVISLYVSGVKFLWLLIVLYYMRRDSSKHYYPQWLEKFLKSFRNLTVSVYEIPIKWYS